MATETARMLTALRVIAAEGGTITPASPGSWRVAGSATLKALEERGLLERRPTAGPAWRRPYVLTPVGRALTGA